MKGSFNEENEPCLYCNEVKSMITVITITVGTGSKRFVSCNDHVEKSRLIAQKNLEEENETE